MSEEEQAHWNKRIELVKECSENKLITKNVESTQIKSGLLRMYNGLLIHPYSYYGKPALQLLLENNTVHEPQEEYIFQKVISTIKSDALMVELGSYWSFYSLSFLKEAERGKALLVEPTIPNLAFGNYNLEINKEKATTFAGLVSNREGITKNATPIIRLDSFFKKRKIEFIDILHSDIQGAEYEMLEGLGEFIKQKKIGYFFISTHSNDIHNDCLSLLVQHEYEILFSIDLDESFSFDGIIVSKSPDYMGISPFEISKRKA